MSATGLELEQKQEEARPRILRAPAAARPIAASENIVGQVLLDVRLPRGRAAVRRAMDYRHERSGNVETTA